MFSKLRAHAFAARPAQGLIALRVMFGLLVTVSAFRFLYYRWVEQLFTKPTFQFSYYGFGWVPRLEGAGVSAAFVALMVLGLLVAAGVFYRLTMPLLFVVFTWVQLTDVSNYLNHYYLVSLLALLMSFMPLGRGQGPSVPAWCVWLLRFQVGVVYVFAGLAKLNSDWLLHAQPLSIWLSARSGLPVIGPLLATREAAFIASWSGFLFDTTIPLWLSMRATRRPAFLAVLVFHACTWFLFPIGMFPFIMVTAATVFFEPDWPRWFFRSQRVETTPFVAPTWWPVGAVVVVAWCFTQVLLPLRTHLYGGDVSWHEQGMRFSWRVMTREKNGSVTFVVTDPVSHREWHVSPGKYLTRVQERELSVQPDLILQLAHHIGRELGETHNTAVEVRVDALASLNGRRAARLIDPTVDLMTLEDGWGPKRWVLPEPGGDPLRLTVRSPPAL